MRFSLAMSLILAIFILTELTSNPIQCIQYRIGLDRYISGKLSMKKAYELEKERKELEETRKKEEKIRKIILNFLELRHAGSTVLRDFYSRRY